MCLSLTPASQARSRSPVRQPSITITKASVEKEEKWRDSIGSRLPSHLSLGSSNFVPTPAPTTPLSLFLQDEKQWHGRDERGDEERKMQ